MTPLTPTEQQAVKAAGQYLSRHHNFANDRMLIEDSFEAGINFALSTLFEPRCVAFAEWVDAKYCLTRSGNGLWYEMGKIDQGRYTTKELYTIYQEQLNKQQDAAK